MRNLVKGAFLAGAIALVSCTGGSKTGDKSLVAISIAPSNPSISAGASLPFSATAHLLDGETKDITADPATIWASSDPAVVAMNPDGTADALAGGQALVTASQGTIHSPAQQVTVTGAPSPTPTPTAAPSASHVVISEVMVNPSTTSEPNYEFIELYNPTGSAVPLAGWKINNPRATTPAPFTIPGAASIAAGGYYTVAHDLTSCQTQYPTGIFNTGGLAFTLLNTGDWIDLRDAGNLLVDEMAWAAGNASNKPAGWCATNKPVASTNGTGVSRKPPSSDGDTCDDWVDNTAPTPGAAPP